MFTRTHLIRTVTPVRPKWPYAYLSILHELHHHPCFMSLFSFFVLSPLDTRNRSLLFLYLDIPLVENVCTSLWISFLGTQTLLSIYSILLQINVSRVYALHWKTSFWAFVKEFNLVAEDSCQSLCVEFIKKSKRNNCLK